jgi:subtilisin family serine protease
MRKPLLSLTLTSLVFATACSDVSETPTGPAQPSGAITQTALSGPELAVQAQGSGFVPGRVLAGFRSGAPIAVLVGAQGAVVERSLADGTRVLSVPPGREEAVAAVLRRNPTVAFAETDVFYTLDVPCGTGSCTTPTDALFGYRWDLYNDGTITDAAGTDLAPTGLIDADIDWLEAFDAIGTVPGSAVIGIIDSGIRATHEEFAGKVVTGYDFFDGDPDPADDFGHGTHVAGIAAGGGDDVTGVPGVAWMPEVQIASAKVCGYLFGILYACPSSAIADGIRWATDNGANVLNLSLGGPQGSSIVQSALQYARQNGVLPICAAGNDAGAVGFPAAFPECVAVSSTNWSDELSSYSNFGPQVELAAPGGDFGDPNNYGFILSAYNSSDSGYAWQAGTSMASPQVAGLAGLLHALGVTDADAKVVRMRSTANDLGAPGDDELFGSGRINVYTAVADLVGAPTNQAPTASFTVSCTDLTCDFADTSTDDQGGVVAWSWDFGDGNTSTEQSPSWDFGDGNTSTEQSPSHTYSAENTYTVTLTATDDEGASGSASSEVTVPIPNQPPTASFTSSCFGYTCDFTDTSTDSNGSVTNYEWDFGDGWGTNAQPQPHVRKRGHVHRDVDRDRRRRSAGHDHGDRQRRRAQPATGGRIHVLVHGPGVQLHGHEHGQQRQRHELRVGLRGRVGHKCAEPRPHLRRSRHVHRSPLGLRQRSCVRHHQHGRHGLRGRRGADGVVYGELHGSYV